MAELPTFIGVVTSRVHKNIVSEVDAKVEDLHISVGKRVKAGELLAKLDDTQLKAELVSAKFEASAAGGDAGAAAAQANAARARLRAESILARNGSTSRMSLKEAQAQVGATSGGAGGAGGRYASAKNRVAVIETQLTKTALKSPIDGVVTRIKVREGTLAGKGTSIAHVFDDSDLLILFKVDQQYKKLIKNGDRIAFKIEGDPTPVLATITQVSDELEPPLNFIIVEADLDDSKLAANQIRVASSGRVSLYDQDLAQKAAAPQKTALR